MLKCSVSESDKNIVLRVTEGEFEGVEFFFGDMQIGEELPEGGAMLNYSYFITSEKVPKNIEKFEEELNKFILYTLEKSINQIKEE